MNKLSTAVMAGGALLVAALAAQIATGTASTGPEASAGHFVVPAPDGGLPAGSVAVWATALADLQAQALFGYDGGTVTTPGLSGTTLQPATPQVYVRAKACAVPVDGGQDPGAVQLGGHLQIVYDDDTETPCASTDPQLEAWVQGRPDAPFACACSTGASCLVAGVDGGTSAAPLGLTLGAGTWSGPGCLPKACVELAGVSSWPAACPSP